MAARTPEPEDSTLHLPRILCLHGGGTNARIFRAQCRGLITQLKSEFRLVYAEAPFASQAGPDVMSVYSRWGPFKRWLRWRPEHPEISAEDTVRNIDLSLEAAMRQDDEIGASGEWVALLGFSQGVKVCASLLYRQQLRAQTLGRHLTGSSFHFGVLLAGRAPLISLDADITLNPPLPDASQITDVKGYNRPILHNEGHVLRIPTIHVHGTRDQGLNLHRQLFEDFCAPTSKRLIEWNGDHRVPLKFNDVLPVARQIRELARLTESTGFNELPESSSLDAI